jgi:anti-sigma B factor antagonist
MMLGVEERQHESGVTVIAFSGRLQLGNQLMDTESRIKRLIEGGCRKLVFDMSNLEAIDSAGLGMLLMCSAAARNAGGAFCLAAPGARVGQVLDMTRVRPVLSVQPDVETAIKALADPARPGVPSAE